EIARPALDRLTHVGAHVRFLEWCREVAAQESRLVFLPRDELFPPALADLSGRLAPSLDGGRYHALDLIGLEYRSHLDLPVMDLRDESGQHQRAQFLATLPCRVQVGSNTLVQCVVRHGWVVGPLAVRVVIEKRRARRIFTARASFAPTDDGYSPSG